MSANASDTNERVEFVNWFETQLWQGKTDVVDVKEADQWKAWQARGELETKKLEGTTGYKYKAELYDEVWTKARSLGYGNVTDALEKLEDSDARYQARVRELEEALAFYAERKHFNIADEDAWDTVSGEPPNFWCDEAGTATVEDGSVAKHYLSPTTPDTALQKALITREIDSLEWSSSWAVGEYKVKQKARLVELRAQLAAFEGDNHA